MNPAFVSHGVHGSWCAAKTTYATDQIDVAAEGGVEPRASVVCGPDVESLRAQDVGEPSRQREIVVDDQHARTAQARPPVASGTRKVNVLPAPGWLDTSTWPPWARAIRATMLRPRPTPAVSRASR